MQTIHLEPNQVPPTLRGSYTGRKFKAEVRERASIPADAGLWSGGSRDIYSAVRLADGAAVKLPGQDAAPWDRTPQARTFDIPAGVAIVRHTIFQGRDLGLTFYVRPDDVAPLLPAAPAAELSRESHVVLTCVGRLISRARREEAARQGVTASQYEAALADLASKGLVKANGAITTEGRNLLGALPRIAGI